MTARPTNLNAKMTRFARTFPSLRGMPGVTLWDAPTLDRWAAETPISEGELETARFVLAVWDPGHPWQCGRFDLMEAMKVWDQPHRAAFVSWAEDPWFP